MRGFNPRRVYPRLHGWGDGFWLVSIPGDKTTWFLFEGWIATVKPFLFYSLCFNLNKLLFLISYSLLSLKTILLNISEHCNVKDKNYP